MLFRSVIECQRKCFCVDLCNVVDKVQIMSKAKTLLSLGAPDCPVVHRTVSGAPDWIERSGRSREFHRRRTTIIHWTVRCAPDCPLSQRSAGPTVGRAIRARHVAEPTVGRGHRTVRCAPDSVRCANGSKSPTVGCARTGKKSAPDSVYNTAERVHDHQAVRRGGEYHRPAGAEPRFLVYIFNRNRRDCDLFFVAVALLQFWF